MSTCPNSAIINLSELERERTHKIKHKLNSESSESAGLLYLLLTISGTSNIEMISDPTEKEITEQDNIKQKYSTLKTFCDLRDIGMLTVHVYKAQGLISADLCGKSDPFCVLELVNTRLQTHTEYKTLSPNWDKIFIL